MNAITQYGTTRCSYYTFDSRKSMTQFTPAEIRQYYDRNTSAFVALGQGGSLGAIHRAVRGPGVRTRDEAFRYVEDRIAERIRSVTPAGGTAHMVDLGCGVGASLCYLAERLPTTGTGITLSPVQAQLAGERIRRARLSERIACIEGDYCDLPAGMKAADLAYAIESFVHGPDPARFFAECRQLVRPGGLLVICDDFRRRTSEAAAAAAIDNFCRGWHVNTLIRSDELQALAKAAGFAHVSTVDLSPYLELGRPRDRAIKLLLALAMWVHVRWSRFDHLQGGNALQECLARGWIGYDLVVFERLH